MLSRIGGTAARTDESVRNVGHAPRTRTLFHESNKAPFHSLHSLHRLHSHHRSYEFRSTFHSSHHRLRITALPQQGHIVQYTTAMMIRRSHVVVEEPGWTRLFLHQAHLSQPSQSLAPTTPHPQPNALHHSVVGGAGSPRNGCLALLSHCRVLLASPFRP
jgi:hypothetical protein